MIEDAVLEYRDDALFDEATEQEEDSKRRLIRVSDNWSDVDDWLERREEDEG